MTLLGGCKKNTKLAIWLLVFFTGWVLIQNLQYDTCILGKPGQMWEGLWFVTICWKEPCIFAICYIILWKPFSDSHASKERYTLYIHLCENIQDPKIKYFWNAATRITLLTTLRSLNLNWLWRSKVMKSLIGCHHFQNVSSKQVFIIN